MRIDLIADTDILIYVHECNKTIEPFLAYNFGISFISELELLGYQDITDEEESKLNQLKKGRWKTNFGSSNFYWYVHLSDGTPHWQPFSV